MSAGLSPEHPSRAPCPARRAVIPCLFPTLVKPAGRKSGGNAHGFRGRPRRGQFAPRGSPRIERRRQAMNVLQAISLKVISALLFAVMSALVRFLGEKYPVGQIVFFRSSFAILPVVLIYAWRNELMAAVRTARPVGHFGRGLISIGGMFFNFSALARLPIVDATAISFAAPLITVAMSAIFLKERVRIYRWSAVIVGFIGVLVMLAPHFDVSSTWPWRPARSASSSPSARPSAVPARSSSPAGSRRRKPPPRSC